MPPLSAHSLKKHSYPKSSCQPHACRSVPTVLQQSHRSTPTVTLLLLDTTVMTQTLLQTQSLFQLFAFLGDGRTICGVNVCEVHGGHTPLRGRGVTSKLMSQVLTWVLFCCHGSPEFKINSWKYWAFSTLLWSAVKHHSSSRSFKHIHTKGVERSVGRCTNMWSAWSYSNTTENIIGTSNSDVSLPSKEHKV